MSPGGREENTGAASRFSDRDTMGSVEVTSSDPLKRVLTRFVLKYTLRAAHLELGGVEREVRRSGKP